MVYLDVWKHWKSEVTIENRSEDTVAMGIAKELLRYRSNLKGYEPPNPLVSLTLSDIKYVAIQTFVV